MRQFFSIGQQAVGYLTLAATATFVCGWITLAGGWAEDWVDEGWTLLNVGERNWFGLDGHSVTWGELRGRTVTDALGRNALDIEYVTLLEVPNWIIVLGLGVISACVLFTAPPRIARDRSALEHEHAGMAVS